MTGQTFPLGNFYGIHNSVLSKGACLPVQARRFWQHRFGNKHLRHSQCSSRLLRIPCLSFQSRCLRFDRPDLRARVFLGFFFDSPFIPHLLDSPIQPRFSKNFPRFSKNVPRPPDSLLLQESAPSLEQDVHSRVSRRDNRPIPRKIIPWVAYLSQIIGHFLKRWGESGSRWILEWVICEGRMRKLWGVLTKGADYLRFCSASDRMIIFVFTSCKGTSGFHFSSYDFESDEMVKRPGNVLSLCVAFLLHTARIQPPRVFWWLLIWSVVMETD